MGRRYKNPPIVEALCEFEFISSQPWDLTIPGLIYEKVKDEFPDKRQQIGKGFNLSLQKKVLSIKWNLLHPAFSFIREVREL